jgi:hypothetical protein
MTNVVTGMLNGDPLFQIENNIKVLWKRFGASVQKMCRMKGSGADEYSVNDVRLECLASEMVSSILIAFALFPHTNNVSCDFLLGRIQNKQTGIRNKFYFFYYFPFYYSL